MEEGPVPNAGEEEVEEGPVCADSPPAAAAAAAATAAAAAVDEDKEEAEAETEADAEEGGAEVGGGIISRPPGPPLAPGAPRLSGSRGQKHDTTCRRRV
jgi:hypothetical protein